MKGAPFRRTTFGRKWAKARAMVGLPKDFADGPAAKRVREA